MGYIGRGQPDRVLTSADIGEGAVTLADISFTDQPANVNITGDYPKQTMRLCDNATVTGDVTIGDGLILAKLASDGDSVTLTSDGTTRTISGTGLIEANTIAQSPNQSLTGMIGELGSTITGSPNLNLTTGTLGSGVTFPTGHVLQVVIGSNTAPSTGTNVAHNSSSSSWPTIVSCAITPSATTSKILINSTVNMSGDSGSFTLHLLRGSQEVGQADASSNRSRGYFSGGAMSGGNGTNQYDLATYSGVFLDDISSGTSWSSGPITYYIKVSFYHSVGTYRINRSQSHRDNAAGFDGVASSHIVLQEIA